MKQLLRITLLFVVLLFFSANVMGEYEILPEEEDYINAAPVPAGPEKFSPGTYHIKGAIHKIESPEKFIFEVYPGTRRQFRLELTGDIRKKFPPGYRFDEIVRDKFPSVIEIEITTAGQGRMAKGRIVKFVDLVVRSEVNINAVIEITDD